jgi:site-specific recombinase XerD
VRRGQRYPAEVRTPAEIERLLEACGRSLTGGRNRVLLVLLWRCGLRLSEALALEPRDVDLTRGKLHVRRGKGGKARYVGLDGRASAEVEAWLRRRPDGARTLLCTTRGTPVQPAYVRNLLRRLARETGVEGRVYPHGLRHLFATSLAEEGADVMLIRDALGHSSVATTDVYLRGLGAGRAVEYVRNRR